MTKRQTERKAARRAHHNNGRLAAYMLARQQGEAPSAQATSSTTDKSINVALVTTVIMALMIAVVSISLVIWG
jgi:hypothetical protein